MKHLKLYEVYYKRYKNITTGDLVKFQHRKDDTIYRIVKLHNTKKIYYEIFSAEGYPEKAENWVSTVRPLTDKEREEYEMKLQANKYNL